MVKFGLNDCLLLLILINVISSIVILFVLVYVLVIADEFNFI